MNEIIIYAAERADGLESAIKANASIAYCSEALPTELKGISKKVLQKTQAYNQGQIDLYGLNSILVSVGWNQNDDVFDGEEVYAARHTPEDKPFNFEHNCDDIIGHITASWMMDEGGLIFPPDIAIEELPEKYHIKTEAVLYKYWDKPELQERMDKIIAELPNNEWFVSMEALFSNFDYGIIDDAGKNFTIARNRETATLSKYLKVYGGTGVYKNYRIGRLLRNITFSGKGLVRKPANPESVILTTAKFKATEVIEQMEQPMADATETVKALENTVAEKDAEIKTLKAELKETNERIKASEKNITSLTEKLATKDAEVAEAQTSVATANSLVDEHKKTVDELTKAKDKLAADLAEIGKKTRTTARHALLVSAGKTDEDAKTLVDKFDSLTDDQFTSIVDLAKATAAAVVVEEEDVTLDTLETDETDPAMAIATAEKKNPRLATINEIRKAFAAKTKE